MDMYKTFVNTELHVNIIFPHSHHILKILIASGPVELISNS